MSVARLVSSAIRIGTVADGLGATFARQLAIVLRDVERHLRPLLLDATDTSRTNIVRAARANRTRTEIRDILQAAGFDDLIDAATGTALDVLVDQVLQTREAALASSALSASSAQKIEALKALQFTDLMDEGDAVARALWRATIRGVFGARPSDLILDDLSAVLDRTEPQIRTLYDTSTSIFTRQVEALQAGDDPDAVFAYMGPADTKTRPFCEERVGKVYRRREIDEMENGQLNDVFLTGGGYNCRHVWTEVSKFSQLRELLDSGQRIPEVERQLDALRQLKKAA